MLNLEEEASLDQNGLRWGYRGYIGVIWGNIGIYRV